MNRPLLFSRYWILAWLGVVVVQGATRGIAPIDETRYLAVAWEMWVRGDFLVPHLNGELYSHKPPLLFWLIQLGWTLFGVNNWWPRLVPSLFALGALAMTPILGRRLWPERPELAAAAPWVVAGSLFWALFTPMVMFDMLLVFLVLAALWGLLAAEAGRRWLGWLVFGTAAGLGILAKGPVMLLHVLPVALLAPWWSVRVRGQKGYWYAALLLAIVLAAAIALGWALPAAQRGGPAYEQAILWHQTADRMVESFAHQRGWWWYLPLLPLLFFPWLVWPPLLKHLVRLRVGSEPAVRFCVAWVLPVFIAFSLISGKQPHYLLPLFPGLALLAARTLGARANPIRRRGQWPVALLIFGAGLFLVFAGDLPAAESAEWLRRIEPGWGLLLAGLGVGIAFLHFRSAMTAVPYLATFGVATVLILTTGIFRVAAPAFDVSDTARHIARLRGQDIPVAVVGRYYGQFQFTGRLRHPIEVIDKERMKSWAQRHPEGRFVVQVKSLPEKPAAGPEFSQPYRSDLLVVWKARDLYNRRAAGQCLAAIID